MALEPLAGPGTLHVFVRDLMLAARIGVYPGERLATQRVRINIDLAVDDPGWREQAGIGPDRLERVVDYTAVADIARALVGRGHVALVETLAERIASACLRSDARIAIARIRIEKLDIMDDAASAGATVERRRAELVHAD